MASSSKCGCHSRRQWQQLLVSLAIAAAALSPCGWAEVVPDDPDALLQSLRDRAEAVRLCTGVPGLAVGYVRGGVKRTLGLGVADASSGRPVTGSTVFGVGSLTKAFSSALLAELLPKNGLKWNSLLKDVIAGFRMNTTLLTEQVTIVDVLTHRTGVTQFLPPIILGYPSAVDRRELERRTQFHAPVLEFRTAWSYNNHMFTLGGATVEHITGRIWEDLINETFFIPLEMTSSTFTKSWRSVPNLSKMYHDGTLEDNSEMPFESLEFVTPFGPAGSILSSADDMLKWLSFNLENVRNGSEAWSQLFTSHIPINGHPYVNGMGIGWMRGQYGDVPFWRHGGSVDGFCSTAVLLHGHDAALFFVANKWCSSLFGTVTEQLTRMLAETVLGLPLTLNASSICASHNRSAPDPQADRAAPSPSEAALEELDLRCIVGTFSHPAYGDVVIASKGLAAKWSFGRSSGALVSLRPSERVYAVRFEGLREPFNHWPLREWISFSADCQSLRMLDDSTVTFRRQGSLPSSSESCSGCFTLSLTLAAWCWLMSSSPP